MGLVYISKLARLDTLPADGFRLACLIMENAGYAGICGRPHGYYAAELKVDKSRVSRLITMLEKENVLKRLGGRSLLLSPTFYHRGSPEEQAAALDHWRQVTEPFAVVQSQPVVEIVWDDMDRLRA